jgi:hypothetical protein
MAFAVCMGDIPCGTARLRCLMGHTRFDGWLHINTYIFYFPFQTGGVGRFGCLPAIAVFGCIHSFWI